jgi:hypothetical protein
MSSDLEFIFLVTYAYKGDIYDRRVWAAFETRDLAEKTAKTLKKNKYNNIEVEAVDFYGN